ncbi:hypothetical protein [Kordiimonas lacus]|uniref:Uncharacterized protein n=1 Tax=Kordiimonas lacus TaxID=637679 RepID=A0A1G6TYP5_9PROT|nr:hypothetical protein [Kordiimonas lacus]SDD34181.1 hypothetical protein SAMN04488071_0409 [Kordiimonas lacus]
MPLVPIHFKGKSNPMTVITPVKRGWGRFLTKVILFIFHHLPLGVVKELAFIHFARWILIEGNKLPRLSPDQPVEDKWPYDLYLFTTNFNGPWDQYIDAFGRIHAVSKGLNMLWYTSRGFEGSWPMRHFKRYIHYFENEQHLYYNAYPGATVRDIDASTRLNTELEAFLADTENEMDDAEFGRRYRAFVNQVSPWLGKSGLEPEHEALLHRARPLELSQ